MTLSTVLEVGIGLALVYYVLGLIVNVIVAMVKDVLDMRAQALEQVLVHFLKTDGDKLLGKFKDNALVQNLKPFKPRLLQVVNRAPEDLRPSEIPNTTFSLAILDVLSSKDLVLQGVRAALEQLKDHALDQNTKDLLGNVLSADDLVKGVRKAIDGLPEKSDLRERLETLSTILLGTPGNQLDIIRAGIRGLPEGEVKQALLGLIDLDMAKVDEARVRVEAWYDDMMKNVSLVFTQNVRVVVVIVSLLVTCILGTDSIHVAQVLWEQPVQREAIVATVPEFISKYGAAEISSEEFAKLSPDEKIQVVRDRIEYVNKIVIDLEGLEIPVTWWQAPIPEDAAGWALKVVGLAVTTVAAAQGSSFWYDILKKINPKSLSKATEKSDSSGGSSQ